MSTDLNPNAVEDLLRSSKLDPKITENLRNHFDQLTAATTPGWHGPNDIPSLHGLEGTFLWFEDSPSLPRNITFTFDPASDVTGKYTLSYGAIPVEQGDFVAVGNNPAIGFAFLALTPTAGTARFFTVAGMVTDLTNRITIVLFNKSGPNGPIQPPFAATRIF